MISGSVIPGTLKKVVHYAEETTEEELKNIKFKLAHDELDRFRWNENDLIAYEERISSVKKEKSILVQKLDDDKREGTQEGILIGQEKGKIEVAKIDLNQVYLPT